MIDKRILVVGSGYVCSNFLHKFDRDNEIFISSRNKPNFFKKSQYVHIGNLLDNPTILRELDNIDYVLFLASPNSFNNGTEEGLNQFLNQLKCFNIEFSLSDIKKIVYLSSSNLYGTSLVKGKFQESNKILIDSLYRKEKFLAEQEFIKQHHLHSKEVTVLRVSNPYGSNAEKSKNGFLNICLNNISQNLITEVNNSGISIRDFLYIDDLINAIGLALVNENQTNILNIGSGTGISLLEVVKVLQSLDPSFEYTIDCQSSENDSSILDIKLAQKNLKFFPEWDLLDGLKESLKN